MSIDKFFFTQDYDGCPNRSFPIIVDREAFTVRLADGKTPMAYRDGYDIVMEVRGNVWVRRPVRVDPSDVAQLHAKILAVRGMEVGSREVVIDTDQGTIWLYHEQECCEQVELVDVTGDPEDIVGGVLVLFEKRTHEDMRLPKARKIKSKGSDPFTFYELRTTKGDVTLRWQKVTDTWYGTDVLVRFKDAE